jgi:putative ABC transport system substrate-binding protein
MAARALPAQQRAIPVIGFLSVQWPGPAAPLVAAFRQGLSEAGYVEGPTLAIEYRWAEGSSDRLPALAAELVRRKVDAITTNGIASTLAAKNATSTIPIVFLIGTDPVGDRLIDSLARPGGNLTGFTVLNVETMAKQLELLSEVVPHAAVIALLVNPDNPSTEGVIGEFQRAAQTKGIQIQVLEARSESEIETAFASLVQLPAGALAVSGDPLFSSRREQLVALASRYAVPAIYRNALFPAAGGLMSYGPSVTGTWRQVGIHVGKILNGAKPTDLPVEQPTKFELVVNLKTASALRLTIPPFILGRADEVLE